MIKKITYEDKVSIQNDENIARKNKVTDEDMNEIKEVVNCNAQDFEIAKTDISNIKSEQTMQNTKITDLETDNTTNKEDISNLKESVETIETDNTEKDKIISDLKEENQRLKEDLKGLPQGQASGESIDLNDSAEMRMLEFEVGGNSRQDTRSGKNFAELKEGTFTSNGITAVVKDGIVTLNGTASGVSFVQLRFFNGNFTLKENQKYSLRVFNENTIGSGEDYCALRLGETGSNQANFSTANSKFVKTFNEDYTIEFLLVRTGSGITYNNYVIKPQLELGDGTDTWEQGGASPSPDYPSEVESCGENVNLFDGELERGTISSSDGMNSNANTRIRTIGYLTLEKGTYTITFNGAKQVLSCMYDLENNYKGLISSKWENRGYSFTINEKVKIRFAFKIDDNTNIVLTDITDIKLEKGSTPTEYSKYGQGNINVEICNKNLFDKDKVIKGIAISRTNGNELTSSSYSSYSSSDYCKVKSDTIYYLGISYSSTNYGICFYDKNKEYISGAKLNNSFTTPNDCEYIRFTWITDNYDINTIQLEEGEATEYVLHQSQTYTIPTQKPFRKVGEYEDTFVKKEGKWYERHYIERYIFTGEENFSLDIFNNKNSRFTYINMPNFGYTEPTIISHINNHFINIINTNGYTSLTNASLLRYIEGKNRIDIMTDEFSTVEEFKNWLTTQYNTGTPVYVDYVLAEPEDIECTTEQTEILDKIENTKTYKGVTHIYSTDKVEPNMKVTYLKDIEMMIQGNGVS